ncbi:MAG: NAD(P)-dependent oxidoreductase [Deltaproteobacteria bacterium]|nr:NAD(P)-dependent oxidoreductase [Deltaproteobacteria bacterium]
MRIFLTGATGFLGSRVVSLLQGDELLCLSRNPQRLSKAPHVRPLLGDVAEPHKWRTTLKHFAPEWCIHLAWEGLPDYSPSRCRANLDAGIGLIKTLADGGIKRIVVAGSCWEYGSTLGAVREDGAKSDCGVFAETKHALRMILESFSQECGIEYRWGRIFFAYGPGQRDTSLIPQCHVAYSLGRQPEIQHPGLTQDFIFADDVAQGIAAIANADIGSGVFNLGSGVPTTVAHIVNRVAKHFGAPPFLSTLQPDPGFWADTSKTTTATGWKAQTSIDDGITQTLLALDRGS